MEAFVDGIYHYKNRGDEAVAGCLARGVEPKSAREVYQKVADSYRSRPDPDLSGIKGVLDSLPEEKAQENGAGKFDRHRSLASMAKSGLVERLYGKK